MAPVWTEEQLKVIKLHNRNILVSAAAGSGKTAVLVERILEMISNEEHPVDIDRLVIVTFTNAAAYEMKQRILDGIEKRMGKEPLNLHLRRQQTLINHAQITTIDSFCLNIIRSYFSEIDLDPGFKVVDEGELKLLMSDVLDELIEDYYQQGNPAFYDFVECFTPEKTDAKLADYILNLYEAAQSNPWPREWLLKCRDIYCHETVEEFLKTPFMQFMKEEIRRQFTAVRDMCLEMKELAENVDGPYMYLEALNDDLIFVESLISEENPFTCWEKISGHTYARLSSKKDPAVDESKKDAVKSMRDTAKKAVNKIAKEYLNHNLIDAQKLVLQCYPAIAIYIDMTLDFMERLDEIKKKKNLIHFSDMEHLALQLLVKKEGDRLYYTNVADELAQRYEEILIDEYQDSNLVQELILNSVSRERFGNPNVFMVGDVKQSIYRFRLARPELFIEKYDRYTDEDSLYQKIELHKNFRSRESVLCSVNEVFEKIMKRESGKIAYDDKARLYAGMEFLKMPEGTFWNHKTEVLVLEHEDESDMSDLEAEAVLCANTIRNLVENENAVCLDKETGQYRRLNYHDIVILMRSARQNADIFVNTFTRMGIPALTESDTGYFSAYEISVLLSLLNIIDNPRQDIHLVAVLKSYFGGLTGNHLAQIRALCPKKSFYEAFLLWEDTRKTKFMDFLDNQRKRAEYVSIYELIWGIVYDTGYYAYVGTMPLGKERQANIDMLMERAKAYENTSYHGLFNFVRYIERLKSYDVDYQEASLTGENDNVVRIMTIHKSKGLEFPVVFLTGTQKSFNNMDANRKLVIDADLGIGTDFLDAQTRVRKSTLVKKAVSLKIRLANLSEEQRILYVAMTRAREKLYVAGCVRDKEKAMGKWQTDAGRRRLTYLDIVNQKCYLDMIMPAALSENSHFLVQTVEKEAFSGMCQNMEEESVSRMDTAAEHYGESISFEYPYEIISMPVKMTVSELKYLGQHEDEEYSKMLVEEDFVPTVPHFISGDEKVRGAERGSAYHKVMELLDFETCKDKDSVVRFMDRCVEEGRLSKEWAQAVNAGDIVKFKDSLLGREMTRAFAEKKLYRERQFVMGIPARTVCPEYPADRDILVQGVVDVYFETEEGIVLCDYKTDNVPYGDTGKKLLVERYKAQLDYYEIALNRMTGKKVVKKSIYSFKLGEEIVFW